MYLEPQRFSKDGYEEHMQVNHLAPALLSVLLLPSLIRGSPSRIVNLNSVVSSISMCLFLLHPHFYFIFLCYCLSYYQRQRKEYYASVRNSIIAESGIISNHLSLLSITTLANVSGRY